MLAKGQFILFVDTKKLSVGINCFPVNNESLEVNGKTVGADFDKIYPVGSIYMSVQPTNPKTLFGIGSWTQLKNAYLFATNATSGTKGTGSGTGTGSGSYSGTSGAYSGTSGSTALTTSQIPGHTHGIVAYGGANQWATGYLWGRSSGDYGEGNYVQGASLNTK